MRFAAHTDTSARRRRWANQRPAKHNARAYYVRQIAVARNFADAAFRF